MRDLIIIFTVLFSLSSHAFMMELQTTCSEPYSNDCSELVCNQDIYKQLRNRANKWEPTGRTPFLLEEHLSFGIPDDSTDFLYGYNNKIIDA